MQKDVNDICLDRIEWGEIYTIGHVQQYNTHVFWRNANVRCVLWNCLSLLYYPTGVIRTKCKHFTLRLAIYEAL